MTDTTSESGVRGRSDLLTDELAVPRDLALISRAHREGWNVPVELRNSLLKRIAKIAEKETVTVATKDGVAQVDGPADANAIRAGELVAKMMDHDAKLSPSVVEHHHTIELGPVTEANIEEHRRMRAERLARTVGLVQDAG